MDGWFSCRLQLFFDGCLSRQAAWCQSEMCLSCWSVWVNKHDSLMVLTEIYSQIYSSTSRLIPLSLCSPFHVHKNLLATFSRATTTRVGADISHYSSIRRVVCDASHATAWPCSLLNSFQFKYMKIYELKYVLHESQISISFLFFISWRGSVFIKFKFTDPFLHLLVTVLIGFLFTYAKFSINLWHKIA